MSEYIKKFGTRSYIFYSQEDRDDAEHFWIEANNDNALFEDILDDELIDYCYNL